MPFTPSHAVVALPFVRTPLIPAAIAVGAMTPDLPLFVRVPALTYGQTHAFEWLPLTVVLALALLLVWRCVLRPAVRELSPRWLAVRLPPEWDRGAGAALRETFGVRQTGPRSPTRGRGSSKAMLLLIASLLLGVVSHIVWDLFTHEGRWGVAAFPALGENWGPLPGYRWLQHGSTAIGLAIIGAWMLVWLVRRDAEPIAPCVLPRWVAWVWWLSLPVVLGVAWVSGLVLYGAAEDEVTVAQLAYRVLPPACAVWGAATVVLCIAVQLTATRGPARSRVRD